MPLRDMQVTIASIDFETYSEAGFIWNLERNKWDCPPGASKKGLQVVGASVYVEHPSFQVLTLSYDLGGGIKRWRPGSPPPIDLLMHVQQGGMISGWNAAGFELKVWRHLTARYHWPPLRLEQVVDTMAHSRAYALPGKLEKAAEVLSLKEQKDAAGDRLIKMFAMPRNPTKANVELRITPADEPEEFGRFEAYCDQDVRTEQEVAKYVPPLTPEGREDWLCDRRINDRGVQVDIEGVDNCIAIINQAHERYNAELATLTHGTVERASEIQKLIGWLGAQGVHTNSLDEEAVDAILKQELPPAARRALEIRQAIGSASVKKVFAMRNMTSADGRLRDLFLFHGARTGRPTGSGPQPTNLPNSAGAYAMECEGCGKHYNAAGKHDCPWCGGSVGWAHKIEWNAACAEDALESFKSRSMDFVEYVWGDAMAAVSNSLRGLFIAAPGHDLICSDYSSIEAVGLAMLAGEQWRIDVFRTHGKIYEMSASQTTGVPFEEILEYKKATGQHHKVRKLGKVQELALGYQGWIGSMVAFGADEFLSEEEMKTAILAWRDASPSIVRLWGGQRWEGKTCYYGVEGAFVQAILYPGHPFETHGMRFQIRGDALYLRLLSGRELTYHRPRLRGSDRRPGTYSISYKGWNSNPKNGPIGWIRMDTWGGRLVENCIAEGTLVFTLRGWFPIEQVRDSDQIYDGLDFVQHGGLLFKSVQPCVAIDGVWMTEDHEVLTDDGWCAAKTIPKPYRPEIWNAFSINSRKSSKPKAPLGFFVRLWKALREAWGRCDENHKGGTNPKLRLFSQSIHGRKKAYSRYEQAPGVLGVAVNERPVPIVNASSLEKLWRSGNLSVQALEKFLREFLGRYGANLLRWNRSRPNQQRGELRTQELPLDRPASKHNEPENFDPPCGCSYAVEKDRHLPFDALLPTGKRLGSEGSGAQTRLYKPVFDIVGCGPRRRFVVLGDTGPFIVHNCNQAQCRDIQWHGVKNLEKRGYPIVLHVYDEDVAEVPEGFGSVEELEAIMEELPPWAADWPIKANGGWRGKRYRK